LAKSQNSFIFTIAPDLAVEVLSSSDPAYEIDGKIREYPEAGE
jgi:Uma2 family endonuclease